jgi:hypothetical protein
MSTGRYQIQILSLETGFYLGTAHIDDDLDKLKARLQSLSGCTFRIVDRENAFQEVVAPHFRPSAPKPEKRKHLRGGLDA